MIIPLLAQIIRENRLLLISVLTGITACCLVWTGVFKQQENVASQHALWKKHRQNADGSSGKSTDQQQKKQTEQLLASALDTHQLPEFIGELLNLISQHDALAGPITYKQNKSGIDRFAYYRLNCSASGRYPDLKRLIGAIEQLEGVTLLESIHLARQKDDDLSVTLDMQISLLLHEAPRQ